MSVCAYPKFLQHPHSDRPIISMESRHRSGISSLEARARARSQEQYIMKSSNGCLAGHDDGGLGSGGRQGDHGAGALRQSAHSAKVDGTFSGYDTINYTLGAKEGQTMTVAITGSTNANFNVFAPGAILVRPRHWAAATWTQNGKAPCPSRAST